jgi:hypothetical protein
VEDSLAAGEGVARLMDEVEIVRFFRTIRLAEKEAVFFRLRRIMWILCVASWMLRQTRVPGSMTDWCISGLTRDQCVPDPYCHEQCHG